MSAFVSDEIAIKEQFKDCLIDALRERFGADKVEVHETPQNLYGYEGDRRSQKAHIIIRRQNVGRSANDVGYEFLSDGTCIEHVSEYDKGHTFTQDDRHRVYKQYAGKVLDKVAKKRGWDKVSTTQRGADTVIRLKRKAGW